MKVLLVSDFMPPVRGGLESHVDALATELDSRGHEVRVATLTVDARPSCSAVRVESVAAASARLPHEFADRPFHPPLPDPVARRALGRILREFEPDVVHAHSWLGVSLPRERPPVVFTAHDYALICHLRTLLDARGACCSGPKGLGCVRCGRHRLGTATSLMLTPATTVGRRILRADRVLAVSSTVGDALAPYVRAPIEIIPNFVGVEPAPVRLPEGMPSGPFALYAGDPGVHKGVGDLVSIWSATHPPGLPLVLATTKPLTGSVPSGVATVCLDRDQMATAWRRATIALVPSRWADPCPTVALEAQRAGRPIVGTNMGGLRDIVRDGVDGFLVAPGDRAALADRIARLVTDDGLRARFGTAARERSRGFAAETVVARVVDVYGDVVRRRGALAGSSVAP